MKKNNQIQSNKKQSNKKNITNKVTDCDSKNVRTNKSNKVSNNIGFDENEESHSFHLDENDDHSFELR